MRGRAQSKANIHKRLITRKPPWERKRRISIAEDADVPAGI